MNMLVSLVQFVFLLALKLGIFLLTTYWVVRKAIRDEMKKQKEQVNQKDLN